jgi:CubicO group peptidase (beta-lactamase class C family)
MRPIGASSDWSWHGYRTSMVEIDGRMMESVSGGSHWGGGIAIHAEDQARIGMLMLQRGQWEGQRLLSERWIVDSLTPCALNPNYGLLWWLNTGRKRYANATEAGFYASGAGGNITWVDPENDLVAVMRWMDPASVDGFIRLVHGAINQSPGSRPSR